MARIAKAMAMAMAAAGGGDGDDHGPDFRMEIEKSELVLVEVLVGTQKRSPGVEPSSGGRRRRSSAASPCYSNEEGAAADRKSVV